MILYSLTACYFSFWQTAWWHRDITLVVLDNWLSTLKNRLTPLTAQKPLSVWFRVSTIETSFLPSIVSNFSQFTYFLPIKKNLSRVRFSRAGRFLIFCKNRRIGSARKFFWGRWIFPRMLRRAIPWSTTFSSYATTGAAPSIFQILDLYVSDLVWCSGELITTWHHRGPEFETRFDNQSLSWKITVWQPS